MNDHSDSNSVELRSPCHDSIPELLAVPIGGNSLLVSVTFADAYGTPSTIVINTATMDGMWFDEDTWPIRDRRILGGPLVSLQEFEKIAAAYRLITGKQLRKPAWVLAHEAISLALEEDPMAFDKRESYE